MKPRTEYELHLWSHDKSGDQHQLHHNTSLNNILLKAFIKYYNKKDIKFQGDIPYIAYILNLVI